MDACLTNDCFLSTGFLIFFFFLDRLSELYDWFHVQKHYHLLQTGRGADKNASSEPEESYLL